MAVVIAKIINMSKTNPYKILAGSIFLLEFDYVRLFKTNIHDQTYCVIATDTALVDGRRK